MSYSRNYLNESQSSSKDNSAFIFSVMIICAVLIGVFFTKCNGGGYLVKKDTAIRALDAAGYRDIQVTSRSVQFMKVKGGSEDDVVRFTCEAVNPAGKKVTVYVYSGWLFKGATIRMP